MTEYVFEIDESRADAMGSMPCKRREEIVRCRDCAKSELRGRRLYCKAPMGHVGYAEVFEDDFCSCGEPREGE